MDVEEMINASKTDWKYVSGAVLSGHEFFAIIREIEYWKARCKAAETRITNTDAVYEDHISVIEHVASVAGETDKARYLETLKTRTDGQ